MKRKVILVLSFSLILVLLLPALAACNGGGGSGRDTDRLVIYNWEDYIDLGNSDPEEGSLRNSMLDDFTRYYKNVTGRDLNITYTTFDTNETMMTKVLEGDANVDLICPSEYSIEKLLVAGCLENHNDILSDISGELDKIDARLSSLDRSKMDEQTLTDIECFDPTFGGMSSLRAGYGKIEPAVMDVITNMFGSISGVKGVEGDVDMTEYMVPYMWGTLGILYNRRIISDEDVEKYGWGVLWNYQNDPEMENKILMKDSVRDTYAAALFYMYEYGLLPEDYYDNIATAQDLINITDNRMLEAAEKALTDQRDHISGYEVDFGKDDMLNGIVYADFAWSGDALWAVEESYDEEEDDYFLGYYCPTGTNEITGKERFSNIWYDGWVIPKSVKNKLPAMMFIDYMCRPENAVRNSVAIGYTCAVDRALMREDEQTCAFLEDQEYDLDEYFDDIGRYPEIDASLGVMRDFGDRNETLVNMWQRAKSGSGVDTSLFIVLAVIIGGVGIALGIYFAAQALKRRPRKLRPLSDDKGKAEA